MTAKPQANKTIEEIPKTVYLFYVSEPNINEWLSKKADEHYILGLEYKGKKYKFTLEDLIGGSDE